MKTRPSVLTWIKTIGPGKADGRLKKLYDRIAGPDGQIDNILAAHSLRPHTLEGHMALYKHVLHNTANHLPKGYLEAIGVYVSMLNQCAYCVEHHFAGLARLVGDSEQSDAMRTALAAGNPTQAFDAKESAGLIYAAQLTTTPNSLSEADINALRESGFDDGEILEINQVAAYFSYANRTVLGLGVNPDGEALGLSPNSSDGEDWSHG